MSDLLSRFEPGQIIGLVAVAGGLLVGLVSVVMGCWTSARKHSADTSLKEDMLNRGMSADEIRTVLDAGTSQCHRPRSRA